MKANNKTTTKQLKAPQKPQVKPAAKQQVKAPAKTEAKVEAKAPTTPVKAKKAEPKTIEELQAEQMSQSAAKSIYPHIPEKAVESLMDDFREIDFVKLDTYLQTAALTQKYCLIFDATEGGKVTEYLNYKGMVIDCYRDVVQTRVGLKEKSDVIEQWRRSLQTAMHLGSNLAINLDSLDDVDFHNEWVEEGSFPITAFDSDKWHLEENHMTVVREKSEDDEETQDQEELSPEEQQRRAILSEKFEMHEKFNMMVVCKFQGDLNQLTYITKNLPSWQSYSLFIVKDMTQQERLAAAAKQKEKGVLDVCFTTTWGAQNNAEYHPDAVKNFIDAKIAAGSDTGVAGSNDAELVFVFC